MTQGCSDASPSWLGQVCSLGLPSMQGGRALSWLGWCCQLQDSLHLPSFPETPCRTLRPFLLPFGQLYWVPVTGRAVGWDFRQKKTNNNNQKPRGPFSAPDSSRLQLLLAHPSGPLCSGSLIPPHASPSLSTYQAPIIPRWALVLTWIPALGACLSPVHSDVTARGPVVREVTASGGNG